jgi:hypothetical protein
MIALNFLACGCAVFCVADRRGNVVAFDGREFR